MGKRGRKPKITTNFPSLEDEMAQKQDVDRSMIDDIKEEPKSVGESLANDLENDQKSQFHVVTVIKQEDNTKKDILATSSSVEILTPIGSQNEEKITIYKHSSWPTGNVCFVCQKSGRMFKCEREINGNPCHIRFHPECVEKYNAGMYDYTYFLNKEGKRICPLHHCSFCFMSRLKSTATYFDRPKQDIVSCCKCLQSFHECCLPAGYANPDKSLVAGNIKLKAITCPAHVHIDSKDAKKFPDIGSEKLTVKKRLHFNICAECEQIDGDGELLYCSRCVRSYHSGCHRFSKLIDNGESRNAQIFCETCLLGDFVRVGSAAIARHSNNSYYPCTVVANSYFPVAHKSRDKYGKYLGQPGFAVIRWEGCINLFACLPITHIITMFSGAYELYGKTMKDKNYREAFEELSKLPLYRIAVPPPGKYTEIKTSVHTRGVAAKYIYLDHEEVTCNCPGNDPNRCGPTTTCHNRLQGYECPPTCEVDRDGNPRYCNNRVISKQSVAKGIKIKESGLKGSGVFATEIIEKNAVIAEYAGELISNAEKKKRLRATELCSNIDEHHYMMDLDSERTIDCKVKGNIARFFNHSCEPNCTGIMMNIHFGTIAKGKKHKMDIRVAIVALRDIKPGEEICFNYRMEGDNIPDCFCGKSQCTGKMGRANSNEQSAKKIGNEKSDKHVDIKKRPPKRRAPIGRTTKISLALTLKQPKLEPADNEVPEKDEPLKENNMKTTTNKLIVPDVVPDVTLEGSEENTYLVSCY